MRKSFSLLEVLIAIPLLAILLGSLFFWYKKISFEKKEASIHLKPLLEERYADITLSRSLAYSSQETDTFFYRDQEGLFFVFNNGPNLEPLLSEKVLGHLYHDVKNQSLCLEVRPHPLTGKEVPMHTSIILKDIREVDFDFYYPPPDPKKIVDPQTIGETIPHTGWQHQWKRGYHTLPTMVKVIVKRPLFLKEREPVEFTYLLEEKNREINYLR